MALTSEKIEGFVNLFLKKRFDGPTEIPECHREWWDMCCSNHKFIAIAAPRNHAKSTAITHSYTLASILLRERQFVLLVSDTEAQSSFFLNDIKKELIDNEDIVKVFGVKGFIKDTETDFIVEFEDGYQARVIAKGSEQKLRGIKWDAKRPDLIICDDMENDEIVMNDDRRKKFRDWFSGALLPCRSSTGIIRYVGTILHMDSMLQRLMPREYDKRNIVTDLYTKSPMRNPWYSIIYRAHTPDFKSILWPDRWPEEKLKEERAHYISQGQGDKYAQEYLNTPIDEANAFFKRGDFSPMREKDWTSNKVFYIGVDLAVTTKTENDYTAFVVGGVDEEGIVNVVETIRERMDSVEIVETILNLNKKYDPQYFFFEKGAITNSILPHLIVRSIDLDNFVSYELFARTVDKKQFAHTIQARMRTGRVKFDKEADWFQALESECLRFPRDAKNDQVDALAILGFGVQKFVEAPTKREQEEDAYLEEMIESGHYEEGRSEITGY
jgi:predicted phage terminase large subunit-like protein